MNDESVFDKIEEAKKRLGDKTADLIAEILEVENYDPRNHKGRCPFHDEKTASFILPILYNILGVDFCEYLYRAK